MLIKKNQTKSLPFNLALNRSFSKSFLSLQKSDIESCLQAMHQLNEYIRYCIFDDYQFNNKRNLQKYCRLLLRFETSDHASLVKCCKNQCLALINDARKIKSNLQIVDLSLCLKESKNLHIKNEAEDLLTWALGTTIRGVSI